MKHYMNNETILGQQHWTAVIVLVCYIYMYCRYCFFKAAVQNVDCHDHDKVYHNSLASDNATRKCIVTEFENWNKCQINIQKIVLTVKNETNATTYS